MKIYNVPSIVLIVIFVLTLLLIDRVNALICCQVWGYKNGWFSGSEVYIITKYHDLEGGQSAGLTAVTKRTEPPFIESGFTNQAGESHAHPYASYQDVDGWGDQITLDNINLSDDGTYKYKTAYVGNNQWEAYFTSGSGTTTIVTADLKTNQAIPYVLSGGESTDGYWWWQNNPIGEFRTKFNRYLDGGWNYWCYTTSSAIPEGTVSSCDTNDHGWTVEYP